MNLKNLIKINLLSLIFLGLALLTTCSLMPIPCSSDLSFQASDLNTIKRHKGCKATVSGYVETVFTPNSGEVTFINLGNQNYQEAFTGVVFQSSFEEFQKQGINLNDYQGQLIKISGTINTYKGKPQIIINDPEQITVLQSDYEF